MKFGKFEINSDVAFIAVFVVGLILCYGCFILEKLIEKIA
jgi:hypothetical protein